jgi:hypothetical protein
MSGAALTPQWRLVASTTCRRIIPPPARGNVTRALSVRWTGHCGIRPLGAVEDGERGRRWMGVEISSAWASGDRSLVKFLYPHFPDSQFRRVWRSLRDRRTLWDAIPPNSISRSYARGWHAVSKNVSIGIFDPPIALCPSHQAGRKGAWCHAIQLRHDTKPAGTALVACSGESIDPSDAGR